MLTPLHNPLKASNAHRGQVADGNYRSPRAEAPEVWVPRFSVPTFGFPHFHRNLEEFTSGSVHTRDSPHSACGTAIPHTREQSPAAGPPRPTLGHAARQTQKSPVGSESQNLLHPHPPLLCSLCFSLLAPARHRHPKDPWPFPGSLDQDRHPRAPGTVTCSPG